MLDRKWRSEINIIGVLYQANHVQVSNQDALRRSCRSRCIDGIGKMVWPQSDGIPGWVGLRMLLPWWSCRCQIKDRQIVVDAGKQLFQMALREQRRGRRVFNHEA